VGPIKKVIVIGLDGLDPGIAGPMLEAGDLPSLQRLTATGGFTSVRTTCPAQTPVAWSTFATGTNPGGHGVFDFIRRDPKTCWPLFSLNRYEQRNRFLPPRAVNLRRGVTVWQELASAGIPSVVLRCPCTFPPDSMRGRMLAGMGVPDLRGGLGTSTFYTSAEGVVAGESENVVSVRPDAAGTISTHVIGPRDPKTGNDFLARIVVRLEPDRRRVVLQADGQQDGIVVAEGKWSEWLRLKWKVGALQSVHGVVRFHLVRMAPEFELYASPVNFDPCNPLFPVSDPPEYAKELSGKIGTFYTTGMVEDHGGLNNGRFDESAFLSQCHDVVREREQMMHYELQRFREGLFFCLFDTPDRVQHMFWRFRESDHPANYGRMRPEMAGVVEEWYRVCDRLVGEALRYADQSTLFIALSDHGFNSFQRGVHLNTWLHDNGFLALRPGVQPGEEAGDFHRSVDWSRTKAYALGIGSLYLNMAGREEHGIVRPDEAPALKQQIASGLSALTDPQRVRRAVRSVSAREQIYSGDYLGEAPDLVVNFASGYRASWGTAVGGISAGWFEDNVKCWGGDHIVDPSLVPGVLFMNRPFDGTSARLVDLAPTILGAFGVPKAGAMEGASLLLS
jgi:predicted AlkP superfamily phosphohydrolase/phosphomutase